MTAAEWLNCSDPRTMLDFLWTSGKATERKLRLFAVACCRRIWFAFYDEKLEQAVIACEDYADGLATKEQLTDGWGDAFDLNHSLPLNGDFEWAFDLTECIMALCTIPFRSGESKPSDSMKFMYRQTQSVASYAARVKALRGLMTNQATLQAEQRAQADLLREIFGPPSPTLFDCGLLARHNGTILKLAKAIYDERRFQDMSILADALEEVGTDPNILSHCRGPGPHVRGCWLQDLILNIK